MHNRSEGNIYTTGAVELAEKKVTHGGVATSHTLDFSDLTAPPVSTGDTADIIIRYTNQNGSRSEILPTITF